MVAGSPRIGRIRESARSDAEFAAVAWRGTTHPRGREDMDRLLTPLSQSDEELGREQATGATPRYSRRLSDKILIAFHHACDQADFEVAEQLLLVLEKMLTRRPLTADGTRRRNMESLVAAHERLWYLRHPATEVG